MGALQLALALAAYASFFTWYGSGSEPISIEEARTILLNCHKATADQAAATAGGDEFDFVERLLDGDNPDDGKSFLMVNFVKLRDRAYFPGDLKDAVVGAGLRVDMTSGAEADAQYGQTFLSYAVRRAAHPLIFSRGPIGRSLLSDKEEDFGGPYDYFAVVRYRSRRDLVGTICDTTAALGPGVIGALKHSGVERTIVVPVSSEAASHVVRLLVAAVGIVVFQLLSRCCCSSDAS